MKLFRNFKFFIILPFLSISMVCPLVALDLSVTSSDLKITKDSKEGYHVYIKQKDGVNSILLTETSKDPNGNSNNYAFRAKEWNAINGDEKRMLNGKFLESEYAKYSLIDSTPEYVEGMGNCFHFYLPQTLVYGYPWTRNGEVELKKGTFINIRTFSLPYADYAGEFMDNPFMLNFSITKKTPAIPPVPEKEPEPMLSDEYNPEAKESFEEIGEKSLISHGPETLVDDIMEAITSFGPDKPYDIVFAVDATGSMKDDVDKLREELIPRMKSELEEYKDIRFGLLLYRDYSDNFRYMNLPVRLHSFTKDLKVFERYLNSFTIRGKEGGDIPEPVYEALYASMEYYKWRPEAQKKIILIGDAQPHPRPRSYGLTYNCTKLHIQEMSAEKGIHIDTIIVPNKKE